MAALLVAIPEPSKVANNNQSIHKNKDNPNVSSFFNISDDTNFLSASKLYLFQEKGQGTITKV